MAGGCITGIIWILKDFINLKTHIHSSFQYIYYGRAQLFFEGSDTILGFMGYEAKFRIPNRYLNNKSTNFHAFELPELKMQDRTLFL